MYTVAKQVLALVMFLFVCCACAHDFRMEPEEDPLVDRSGVNESALQERSYDRILILPADAEQVKSLSDAIANARRQFLKNNLTVIDPSAIRDLKGILDENLSTVELAVRAGKKQNADGVLVARQYGYLSADSDFGKMHGTRYFKEGNGIQEIDRETFEVTPYEEKFWLEGKSLHFEGKLVDVRDGNVNASFEIYVPFVNITDPYEASVEIDPEYYKNHRRSDENFKWGGTSMEQKLEERANEYLFRRIVQYITTSEASQP